MPRPGEINKERKSLNEINTSQDQKDIFEEDKLNQSFDESMMRKMNLEPLEEEEESVDLSKMKNLFTSIFTDENGENQAPDQEQNLEKTREEVKTNMPPKYVQLNRAFDRERTEDFLSENITAGYDMEKAGESYATQFKSIQKAEEDVAEISVLLRNVEMDRYEPVEKDVKKAKLAAVQGRKLSHLMLNDQKLTGDSELMDKVKDSVADVETLMTAKQRRPLSARDVDKIGGYYRSAIEACQTYCAKKNPWFSTGKRRKAKVEATLKRLMAEYDAVQLARFTIEEGGSEAEQITTGIQLLSLTASQKLADSIHAKRIEEDNAERKEGYRREKIMLESELKARNDELEAAEQINEASQLSLQEKKAEIPGYTELSKECDELKAEFDKLYEKVGFAGLNMPSFLGGNDEIKALDKKLKEKKEKLEEMEDTLSDDEEYIKLESLANANQKEVDRLRADIKDIEFRVIKAENSYNNVDIQEAGRLRKEKEDLESSKRATADERKEKIRENDNKIAGLPKMLEPVIRILASGAEPTTFIKNKKKISDKERAALSTLLEVRKVLSTFRDKAPAVQSLQLDGGMISLIQDRFGNITVKYNDVEIPISNQAKQSAGTIADDVMRNQSIYGEDAVYDVIADAETDLSRMSRGDLLRTREHCAQVLFQLAGLPKTLANNIKVEELRRMALEALEKKNDKEAFAQFKEELSRRTESLNNMKKTSYVNTVLNQELQQTGERVEEGVIINIEKKSDKDGWDNREQPVIDFIADLISMKDTWKADEVQVKRGERIKRVLLDNAGAIAIIISDQFRDKEKNPGGLVEGIIDKLPLFALGKREVSALKRGVSEALEAIRGFIEENLGKLGDQKKTAEWALKNMPTMLAPMIKTMIEQKLTPQKLKALGEIEDLMDEAVSKSMEGVQEAFDKSIKDVFEIKEEKKEEEQKKEENKELTEEEKAARAEKKRIESARKQVEVNTEKLNDTLQKISDAELEIAKLTKLCTDLEASDKLEAGEIKTKTAGIEKLIDNHKQSIERLRVLLPGYEDEISKNKKLVESAAKNERMSAIRKRMASRNEPLNMYRNAIKRYEEEISKYKYKIHLSEQERNKLNGQKAGLTITQNALKEEIKKTASELNKVIEDSVKGGKSGQSLFMKNVLMTYFKSMPVIDQRSMLAGAIRNSRPIPGLTDQQKNNLTDDQKMEMMSDMIGGMFKGAGPLFQKMLQGLPIKSLPKGLRKAVEDTQDSLAPIPEEVVRAHMESIRERSNGKIEKIEVNQSLGAASVGQAFLCRVYGPEMKEGKNVVVKILRPDARNRMMREKEIMLEAARKTDEAGMHPFEIAQKRKNKVMGGMEATYTGNLQRIEEELDLNIEAQNCREGQVYDEQIYDKDTKKYKENVSDSMKLSNLVDPTSDTCVMEIAGSKTVKRYMSDVNEEVEKLLWKFCDKKKEIDSEGRETGKEVLERNEDGSYKIRLNLNDDEKLEFEAIQSRMKELLSDMEKRQAALAQLSEKWVTQGIFEKGYYHGDLHAGNIMISDTGVTVIDFGNATILKPEEQKQIIRMMVAAIRGDVDKFRHGFHMLLKNTPEEVYQEKRDELTLMLEDIMQTGNEKSAAERIAAALVRAQEIGLELPPTIANFSSCQMRLQNTLNDMNNNLKILRLNTEKVLNTNSSTEDQRQLDPIRAVKFENRSATAETLKKNISAELRITDSKAFQEEEQNIRQMLRDKTRRNDLRTEFKLKKVDNASIAALDAELKKLDDMLSGRVEPEPLTEELKQKFADDDNAFEEMYPALTALRDAEQDADKKQFISTFMREMERMFYDVDNDEAVHDEVIKNDPILKNANSLESVITALKTNVKKYADFSLSIEATETEKKLQRFYDAQDNRKVTKEELDRLENEVWLALKDDNEKEVEKTKNKRKNAMLWKLPLEKDLVMDLKKQNFSFVKLAVESCIKGMEDSTQLREKSDKLFALCGEVMEDADKTEEKQQEIKMVFDEVFELVWEARKKILRKMRDEAKDAYVINKSAPDEFLDIMGNVLIDRKGSVTMMLDPVTSVKIIWEGLKEKLFGD